MRLVSSDLHASTAIRDIVMRGIKRTEKDSTNRSHKYNNNPYSPQNAPQTRRY
jgi:hypothetical protein